MWGVFEVFIDTIIICTITAMAVILSGVLEAGSTDVFGGNGGAAAAAFNAILPGKDYTFDSEERGAQAVDFQINSSEK